MFSGPLGCQYSGGNPALVFHKVEVVWQLCVNMQQVFFPLLSFSALFGHMHMCLKLHTVYYLLNRVLWGFFFLCLLSMFFSDFAFTFSEIELLL